MISVSQSVGTVGLFTSGLTAGLTLAYPILITPLFQKPDSGLTVRDRLRIWDRAYHHGLAAMPLLALATATAFVGSALAGDEPVLETRMAAVVSLLHVSIIPFTLVAIRPLNNVLIGMRKTVESTDKPTTYAQTDVGPLFARWAALHNVRVGLSCAGFVVALLGTLGAVRM